MQADVHALMEGELGQWLRQQDSMRDKAREDAESRWFYGGIALLPILLFLWIGGTPFDGMRLVITIGGIVALGVWGYQPIADAKKAIKVGINSAIARSIGVEYEHDVTPGPEFGACKAYGLVPKFDREEFEDRWFGEVEGHGFDLYEAHLEEQQGSNKNRRWVTVFRGAIITMEFGRPFNSTTLLQRAGKNKKWFGLGGRKDCIRVQGKELGYVDQVHPEFDDVFEVWSDDQMEARVIVHPSYIEQLIAVERAFEGKAVRALFSGGSMVIAVESGNLFETGSLDAIGDRERVEEAAKQFGSLAGLALAINQNERGRVLQHQAVPIGAGDRRRVRRQARTFGRKTA